MPIQELILALSSLPKSELNENNLAKMKNEFSARFGIPNIKNIDMIQSYKALLESHRIEKNLALEHLMQRRKTRSQSGVAVITCMTKAFPCPGKCVYCPSEPGMPKSYLSNQPASMRAVLNKFSAFSQVQNRLASLMITGHDTSKIEIIVNGGTWSALPKDYQESFITDVYNGLNQEILSSDSHTKGKFSEVPDIEQTEHLLLEESMKKNETSPYRCVGLTLETRPDWVTIEEIKRMRKFGATRIEMGVQSLNDHVQEITKRGHTIDAVRNATKLLRDAGLKIGYHLMPGLPGSNREIDMESVRQTFQDEDFLPDWIKMYPCMVTKFSEIENWHKEGKYTPLTDEELIPLLLEMKRLVPRYTRITRLIRDIPSESILAGCKTINLRQLIEKEMKKQGIECQCIRCREIKSEVIQEPEMRTLPYKAAGGDEYFLSFDDAKSDKLIALLRLRIPSQYFTKEKHFMEELEGCALIREVHTYGQHTSIGAKDGNAQHFGFGRKLIAEAERIAKEDYGLSKIAVISGVGVREYYKKQGYTLHGTYMVKHLD